MAKSKRLVLVDGASYLYRAYYAMPNLTNSSGEFTGAVYGVTNMLKRLLSDESPQYMAFVFDAKGKTFRDEIYDQYKANRPSMPKELRPQIDYVHQIVEAMGMPLLVIPGVEADDVIGTLAAEATKGGFTTLVSTGDKDLAQLVNDKVNLVDTMKDVVYDIDGVVEKYGVPPELIIDYLTLIGDTSDNIPGVPKCGPKTAVKWLAEYGDLEGVIANADAIKGKVGENLRDSLEQIPMAKELVTIKLDVDVGTPVKNLKMGEPDEDKLRELFAHLEFKTWLSDLGGVEAGAGDSKKKPKVDKNYETITTMKALDAWLAKLKKAGVFAFDTETTSINAVEAELVGFSFSNVAGEACYVPLAHNYEGAPKQLDRDKVIAKVKPLLENPKLKKIGQNLKYDMLVLKKYDVDVDGIAFDTMLESYVLDSTASRHDMDSLALKYLGLKTIKYEDVAGKGKSQVLFDKVEVDVASQYAAEDADITVRLHDALWPKLKDNKILTDLFENVEMPLVPVLARIESNGVMIDADMLREQSAEITDRAAEIESQAHNAAGTEFNIASPKQIQEVLFDRLGLPVLKKTPKGQPSTAEEVLAELANDYDLPRMILEHRSLAKLRSTYTDKLPTLVNADTGRIHTSYHQAVAATGRLSSSEPNLQNIPIRTAEGRRIREAFVPAKGFKLVAADYSQIELRIMAHLSGDEGLTRAFANGEDVHKSTAAEVFGVKVSKVDDEQRRAAKAINFGLIYGMSAFGLGKQLKIERGQAQDYVDTYFARYPGVREFMDRTRESARENGFVETVFGRRLYLPEINASNHVRRQYAERTAINAPMQGTAADLIKKAMIAVDAWLLESGSKSRIIMQVHDELVLEVPTKEVAKTQKKVAELMSGIAELDVPLEVDSGSGNNWAKAHS